MWQSLVHHPALKLPEQGNIPPSADSLRQLKYLRKVCRGCLDSDLIKQPEFAELLQDPIKGCLKMSDTLEKNLEKVRAHGGRGEERR